MGIYKRKKSHGGFQNKLRRLHSEMSHLYRQIDQDIVAMNEVHKLLLDNLINVADSGKIKANFYHLANALSIRCKSEKLMGPSESLDRLHSLLAELDGRSGK